MWKQHKGILFSIIEGKGGVGKSLVAQILYPVLGKPKNAGFDRTINSRNSSMLKNQPRLLGNQSRSAKRPH
jgi:MinD superfamily P-loop ATPase